jgi:hypothetical protein
VKLNDCHLKEHLYAALVHAKHLRPHSSRIAQQHSQNETDARESLDLDNAFHWEKRITDGVWLGSRGHRFESSTSEFFADDGESGPLLIRQQKTGRQMGSKDSILRQRVFLLPRSC